MRKSILLISSLCVLAILVPSVLAGTGSLRISPQWPVMVESPADFTIWCQSGSSYDVNILVIVTEECQTSMPLNDAVIVKYGGITVASFDQGEFTPVTGMGGVYVPPSGTTNGARYTVASLKDHLDEGLIEPIEADDTIYWAMAPLDDEDFDPLDSETKEIQITLNSDAPRMLVYLLGKSENGAALFDMKVPPTNPGFIVPEVATVLLAGSSFGAIAVYAVAKKQIKK